MGATKKSTRKTQGLAAKKKGANHDVKESDVNSASKPEEETVIRTSFKLPIRVTLSSVAIEHVQAGADHSSTAPEDAPSPLVIDEALLKAYIGSVLHSASVATAVDDDGPEDAEQEASSIFTNHIISNGASPAARQQIVDRFVAAGVSKAQLDRLIGQIEYEAMVALVNSLCDPVERRIQGAAAVKVDGQILKAFNYFKPKITGKFLRISPQNSAYLAKILPQADIAAFNNSAKDISALTLLRVAYDIRLWEILEEYYSNGEIFDYLPPDDKVLPSVELRCLYGRGAASHGDDDDAMSTDGQESESKAGGDSEDEDVVDWEWDTLECPLSVFKLLEFRARKEMAGMLREYPFLPTHTLLP